MTNEGMFQFGGLHCSFLTSKERDTESGLDYFLARYYSSAQGRFTSRDEFTGDPDELFDFTGAAGSNPTFYADLANPQSLNKFQYCFNNPLKFTDPDGHDSGDGPTDIWIAYEKAQVTGFAKGIWAAVSFQTKAIIDPKGTVEDLKQTFNDAKETIKTDIGVIKNPIEGAKAVIGAIKEDPKKAAEIVGETNGQVAASIVIGEGVGSVIGSAVKGAAAKLGQRGGIGVGSSKVVRVVAKSNPSETSVGVIAGGKRVLDVGKAQIKPGGPKQFHIRVKDGPHAALAARI